MIKSSDSTKSAVKTEAPVDSPIGTVEEAGTSESTIEKGMAPLVATKKPHKSRKRKEQWGHVFTYLILIFVSIILILTLVWLVYIFLILFYILSSISSDVLTNNV